MNISELSVSQLQRAVAIKQKLEKLQSELSSIIGRSGSVPARRGAPRRRTMSAAARARIAAAQRARWAATKKKSARPARAANSKPRRKVSAAARKLLAQRARARWAAAKASGRNKL